MAIKSAFLLKNLRFRINYFLDSRIDRTLSYDSKLNFMEYIVSVLNPDFYSSKIKRSYLLHQNYQRILFYETYENLNEREKYDYILKEIIEIISEWEPYELYGLLMKNNLVTNILRKFYSVDKLVIQPPQLDDRKKTVLGFLKMEFFLTL